MTFAKGKKDIVPKKTPTSEIAHIRQKKTEAENSAASSADDVKRSFARVDEEAEKGSPPSFRVAFALRRVVDAHIFPSSKPQRESRRKSKEGEN